MIIIYEHFQGISKEKQERIIRSALSEFGRYGYKKTSVEQIAVSANIAKGMVFHYFTSKKGLYEYLFQYAFDFLESYFGDLSERIKELDYLEQYQCMVKIKLQAYLENPSVFEFMTMIFLHSENIEISEKTKIVYKNIMQYRNDAFTMIASAQNTFLFRDDLDQEKAKKYVAWLIEGYSQSLLGTIGATPLADLDLNPYWEEFDEILDDLKKVFYKPESK